MAQNGRLQTAARPTRYDLRVAPDLESGQCTGEVGIDLAVDRAGPVALHALGLDVELVALEQAGRRLAATLTVVPGEEQLVVDAPGLAPGPARLTLRFAGRLGDGLVGFYRTRFTDDAGVERVLAATQFEAPHARRAFPCFDEPEYKAVFSVTLDVAPGLVALSNGPEVGRERLADGRERVRFGDTIPMSTYLVAFVVGPLHVAGPVDAGGTPLRVAHVPGREGLTRFALDVGAFALVHFEGYYGIPYPGEKLDLVALPEFAFGAMENLGCVTFRESLLLLDESVVTEVEVTNAALTIVHELAHMWFGDLVTMRWWNGIWLNEAFATFMEYAGVDAYRPEWAPWERFATSRAAAMEIDALTSTRPVEYEVRTPAEAEAMFDTLTYQKGGGVVRMLERWLGAEAFRDGVRHYLDRHRFANTETTDLWDALEEATGAPVRRIMDSWILQPGLPEVVVARDGDRVVLTARRSSYGEETEGTWSVPVLVRVHAAQGPPSTEAVLLDGDATTIEVPSGARVVVGAGGEGFFRVAYPPEWRDDLLVHGLLTPLERFAVVDGAWSAVLTGARPATDVLHVARMLRGEPAHVVWRALAPRLGDLSRLVDGRALDRLRAHVRDLASPTVERLGWEPTAGEPASDRRLRGLLLELLGTLGHDQQALDVARARDGRDGVDPELAAAAVAVVAHNGDVADFERARARMAAARTPQEELRYLYALAAFPDAGLVASAVDLACSDAVRRQNAAFLLQRALRNREHGAHAWQLVAERWDEVVARVPAGLVPRLLEGITWLVDDASEEAVPAFLAAHPVEQGHRSVAQHLELRTVHRRTRRREGPTLATTLLDDPGTTVTSDGALKPL